MATDFDHRDAEPLTCCSHRPKNEGFDKQIRKAMRVRQYSYVHFVQVVVEPSGAASLAAVLSDQMGSNPSWCKLQNVGLIVSGGNIDLAAKGFWSPWHT